VDPADTPKPPGPNPPGIWFAVDVGTVRVGVARSDPRGVLALPVATLTRDPRSDRDIAGVVVGLPRTLAGREGTAADMARSYGTALAAKIAPVPLEYLDERLTTVSAQRKLHQGGIRGPAGRAVIDQAAAVELLQHWLELRRP
jgi:putative Holliday junction resolvase